MPNPRHARHTGRTHLSVQPSVSMGRSTDYHRMSSGDVMPPSTGRVHLVSMGNLADPEEHFMRQMTEDANMGAKHRKKGPFKHSRGESHVLNRCTRASGNATARSRSA